MALSNECIDDDPPSPPTAKIQPILLRPEKQRNSTCRRMIFQGTQTTKIFQAKEIEAVLSQEPDYQFCSPKIIYGMDISDFHENKIKFLNKYKTMQDS